MAQTYSYRAQMEIVHGGYPGELKGVSPVDTYWHTGEAGKDYGSLTYTYYYTDSNTSDSWSGEEKNKQSSRVELNATDSWTAEFDENNVLTIKLTTRINSIARTQKRGNPNYLGTWGRDIEVGRSPSNIAWRVNGDNIGYEHTLATNINLGTETITLQPGGDTSPKYSIYIRNHTAGFPNTEAYLDEMHAGIWFKNNADPDYRPGATYIAGTWESHNRTGGACDGYHGSGFEEQRTAYGGSGTDNPPYYHNGTWYNQYKVGAHG